MVSAIIRRVVLLLALCGAMLLQLTVLYTPGSLTPTELPFPGFDKLIHIGIFALPVFFVRLLTPQWWPVVAMVVHVPLSELIQQLWIPQRSGDSVDILADLTGIALGLLGAVILQHSGRALAASRQQPSATVG